jgi:hypothetical protein
LESAALEVCVCDKLHVFSRNVSEFYICDKFEIIVGSGLLYAIGGHDGTKHLRSGEVFDPSVNTWKSSVKPMSTPR